jgi:cytochrome c peroxidase
MYARPPTSSRPSWPRFISTNWHCPRRSRRAARSTRTRPRGKTLFAGKADCARCHVPPLYTEPGWNLHKPEEIGIDGFQADRSPERRYRTTPLAGLWSHAKGGYYHDGRFPTLPAVIDHYDRFFTLGLSSEEKRDLAEFLKSL